MSMTTRPARPGSRSVGSKLVGALSALCVAGAGALAMAGPAQAAPGPIVDVAPSDPFYEEITWLVDAGIATGTQTQAGVEFRPVAPVSRQAIAAFFYRAAGAAEDYEAPDVSLFVDVSTDDPFYEEISWLAEAGIATGTQTQAGFEFRPTAPVSRQAAAAFFARAAEVEDYDAPDESLFLDVSVENPFYAEISWLAEAGIAWGTETPDGALFKPLDPVSRQAAAAFFFRFLVDEG